MMTRTSLNELTGRGRRRTQGLKGAEMAGLVGLPHRASYAPPQFDSQQDSLRSSVKMKVQHEWR